MEGRLSKDSIKKISQLLSSRDARMFLSEPVPSLALLPGSWTPKVRARGEGEWPSGSPYPWALTLGKCLLTRDELLHWWKTDYSALRGNLEYGEKASQHCLLIFFQEWKYYHRILGFWAHADFTMNKSQGILTNVPVSGSVSDVSLHSHIQMTRSSGLMPAWWVKRSCLKALLFTFALTEG